MRTLKDFHPWDDSWREQLVYITIPERVDSPVEMNKNFNYPLFVGAFEERLKGEEFWKAIAGTMVFVLGHEPNHPEVKDYIYWLNRYNRHLVDGLIYDSVIQTTQNIPEKAIWLLQAAVLLQPERDEAHYNLGLAYYQMGTCYYKLALQYFHNALELQPQMTFAAYYRDVINRQLSVLESEGGTPSRTLLKGKKGEPYVFQRLYPGLHRHGKRQDDGGHWFGH